MKKLILLLYLVLWVITFSFSQTIAPDIAWQNTIGGSDGDYLYSISQTSDKGYVCGGWSGSSISVDKTENCIGLFDYWVVKLDSLGSIEWNNTIGGNEWDFLYSIQQTIDGGYICGGHSKSNISPDKSENSKGQMDYWIVKLDSVGNIEWENTIGGNDLDELNSIIQTSDGCYICGGWSASNISSDKTENCKGGYDYWIIKLDVSGNIIWQKTIGGNGVENLYSIKQCSDGGYICGGGSNSDSSGNKAEYSNGLYDFWLVKLDSIGNIEWQNTIGGNDNDFLYSVQQTIDAGFICGGLSKSGISGDKTENCIGEYDYWAIKLDVAGNIEWQKTLGGINDDYLYTIQQTTDGNYICGGTSESNISGNKTENCLGSWDYWIIKLDSLGNIIWQNTIGGSDDDYLYSLEQSSLNGIICGGYSKSNISGDKTENSLGWFNYWIVKLYPDTTTGITSIPSSTFNIQTTPNPFTNELTVGIPQLYTETQLTLLDVYGKQVLTQTIPAKTLNHKLQTLNLPKGFYFLQLQSGKQTVTRKVVKM